MAIRDMRNKGVKIELDNVREIRFDLNAFCELEDIFGSIDKAFEALAEGSMKSIRGLLFAGLVHEDEALTIKKVGALVGFADMEVVAEKIGQAMGDAMPDQDSDVIEKK